MLDLTNLQKSIGVLDNLLTKLNDPANISFLDKTLQDGLVAGAIQNFEVTYELSWKFLKRWLEQNLGSSIVDGVARRELFRYAHENLLIDSVEQWMLYHRARNETSYTYDSITSDEVFAISKDFLIDAKKLYTNLVARND